MKKYIKVVFLVCLMLSVIAACSNTTTSTIENESAYKHGGQVSAVLTGKPVTILTGASSAVYFQLGQTMSEIYGTKLDALASVQTTGASGENVAKISEKKAELGFAMANTVTDAYSGKGDFAEALPNLRAIASLYPNYMQIVVPKSAKIRTLQDMKGKNIALGEKGSGTELMAKQILQAAGITYDDLQVNYLSFSEGVEGIKNGTIDVAFFSSGYPNSGIQELAATDEVDLIPIPKELTAELKKKYPVFARGIIPANIYKGVQENRETVVVNNLLITHEEISEEAVYELTKTLFDHLDDLRIAHSSALEIELEKAAQKLPLPLHPGAEKYYKERGLF